MEKMQNDRTLVRFSTPDPATNTVSVFRVMADNSTETIGQITPDLSNGEDSIIYISTNNQGEEIFPPTADFIEIENKFNKYAEELSQISLMEEMTARAEEYEEREETLKNLRNWKLTLVPKLINR